MEERNVVAQRFALGCTVDFRELPAKTGGKSVHDEGEDIER